MLYAGYGHLPGDSGWSPSPSLGGKIIFVPISLCQQNGRSLGPVTGSPSSWQVEDIHIGLRDWPGESTATVG